MSGGKGRTPARRRSILPPDDRPHVGPGAALQRSGAGGPEPGQRILVAGGAGYIGCVLVPRLLERGYRVRVLDRLYFGEEPLASFRDRVELVVADVRDIPASAFDGVDGVINLSGLSNDPTAEYDPEANWQMNALATETLGRACVERGIERYVFASSCSLYDGLPPGMHDESGADRAARGLRDLQALRRGALLELAGEGLTPVIMRNGTVYGWSPRMRFDLVVNTFVKDALLERQAAAPRRRLDVAPARGRPRRRRRDDRRLRGARRAGPRRDLQRPALELPDPRARDDRGRDGRAGRPRGQARGGARAHADARLRVLEREAVDDARASSRATRCSTR